MKVLVIICMCAETIGVLCIMMINVVKIIFT